MSLIQQIVKKAESTPDAIAIEGKGLSVSYKELLAASYSYANKINERNSWVAIDTSIGWKVYPAILACWMTGNGYVPVNFNFPKVRVEEIQSQVKWSFLISDSTVTKTQESFDVVKGEKAYLLFTSGTTGAPKGVPISMDNLDSFAQHYLHHENIHLSEKDKFLQSYELTFDVSVFCFLIPFLIGGTLVLPEQTNSKQLGLFKAIQDFDITVTSFVPSVIRLTQDFLPRVKFPKLRYSFFSGEALMGEWAITWMESIPNAQVYNCYGPTETVIVCTEELLNDLDENYFTNGLPLPLGEKFDEIDFELIEREVVYEGRQVFKGYLNEEPISKFYSGDLAHYDEKGKLIFDGRKDNQIQWNGFRIELDEIDRVLSDKTNGWVKTVFLSSPQKLVVFSNSNERTLVDLIKESFPDYYKPSAFVQLKEPPLNDNGKVDVKKLKELV